MNVRTHYKNLANEYDQKWPQYLEKTQQEAVNHITLKKNLHILDAGCGTGGAILEILKKDKTANIKGIDITPEMLTKANEKVKQYRNISLITGDLHKIPFNANSFDCIINLNNLHYLHDPEQVFKEFNRVLKKEGELIIVDWSCDFFLFKIMNIYWRIFHEPYAKSYSTKEIKMMLEKNGFTVKKIKNQKIDWFWRVFLVKGVKA